MLNQIGVELFKLRKRRMTWIMLVVLAAFLCLVFFAVYGIVGSPPSGMPGQALVAMQDSIVFPGAFETIFSSVQNIGSILMIVLVASSVGSEYGWNTVRQTLTRRGIRYQYVLSKLVSFIVYAMIGTVIAAAFGFLLALLTTQLVNGQFDWSFMSASYIGDLFAMFGWTIYTVLVYILLAMLLALVGRSAIAGIGGALGYYFIEAIAIGIFLQSGGWLAEVPNYLIGHNISALLPSALAHGPFASSAALMPTTLHASVTLTIYCIVFLAASLILFKRRDVTV